MFRQLSGAITPIINKGKEKKEKKEKDKKEKEKDKKEKEKQKDKPEAIVNFIVGELKEAIVPPKPDKAILQELVAKDKDNSWHLYHEKKPLWAEKPLSHDEYEVGIVFTQADSEFGDQITNDLRKKKLKCTTDPDHISNSRACVLVYSEDTASDQTVLRLLTRAAERYEEGNTVIFPVVHPRCSVAVLNQIPNSLAYSLSNTTFINLVPSPSLASDSHFVRDLYADKIGILEKRVKNYVNHLDKWDISGLWHLRIVLKDSESPEYEVLDFTIFLDHTKKKIEGTTVNGLDIEGSLIANQLRLDFSFLGKWQQLNEMWSEDKFTYVAHITAGLKVQGTRFEGSYVDFFRGVARSGSVSGTLEEECLSGYYDVNIEGQRGNNKLGLIQRGDRIFGDISGMHGLLFSGIANEKIFWAYSVGSMSSSYNAVVEEEYLLSIINLFFYFLLTGRIYTGATSKRTVIKGNSYIKVENQFTTKKFKATKLLPNEVMIKDGVHQRLFTKMLDGGEFVFNQVRSQSSFVAKIDQHRIARSNSFKEKMKLAKNFLFSYEPNEKQGDLEKLYAKKFNIDITPYVPLLPNEYEVFIGSADDCKGIAETLKDNLSKAGITRVTLDISQLKLARTFILLLSCEIRSRNSAKLVEATYNCAVEHKPIFNIGLAEFREIFNSDKWGDKGMHRRLRDALARLNQTDTSTLDPANLNFKALVRRIKSHVEPPIFNVTGLWLIQFHEEPTLDFMLFVKQDGYNLEACEFCGYTWKGIVNNDEFILRRMSLSGTEYEGSFSAKLKENGKYFIGSYKTVDGTLLSTFGKRETDGISGLWEIENSNTKIGIVQRGGGRQKIFQIEQSAEKTTYEGSIRNTKTGHVLSGFFYTENHVSRPFIAKSENIEYFEDTYDVMISYKSTDVKFVNLLQESLQEVGLTCWRDRRMEVGTNWSEDITRAVRCSKCIVCCISDNYVKSSLCTKEILMAADMGKIIVPLVLPDTETKQDEWDKLVKNVYASLHPPHVVAKEIAKTSWCDFRPYSKGKDPVNLTEFKEKYPLLTYLNKQLLFVKRKGCLWDVDGEWKFIFVQESATNEQGIESFEVYLMFDHTKLLLTGKGILQVDGKIYDIIIDNARLDSSVLTFHIKFLKDVSLGAIDSNFQKATIIVTVMIRFDGKSFGGKFTSANADAWCNKSGTVIGLLAVAKK